MKAWVVACVALSSLASGQMVVTPSGGNTPGKAEVTFHFERPGLAVPKFTLTVREDGSGSYKADEAPVSGGVNGASALASSSRGQSVDRALRITPTTTDMIFRTARSLHNFDYACESKAKNVADTGKKTLSYAGPDGQGSCTYNYSELKSINQLTDTLQAIAFTLDEGRKIAFLHRYDRLGLYQEMDVLMHEVQEKRALEIGNISPELNAVIADEALMQKVRERAQKLLAQAQQGEA
jgi:hypothetical protein